MATLNITAQEARIRAAQVRDVAYHVELNLALEPDVFGSKTTITFQAVEGAVGTSTFVDFVSDDVRSIVLNGQPISLDDFDGTRITVGPLQQDNTLVVIGAANYMNTGEGLHRFQDPVDQETYLYTQFEVADARRAFAVFEQPDIKATFRFTITAPKHWQVVSNQPTPQPTTLTDQTEAAWLGLQIVDEQYRTWDFEPTPVVSCYITALIAGPYHRATDSTMSTDGREIELGLFCRASLAEYLDTEDLFTLTKQGFEFFENEFNTPYPFTKYDQLFVPEFNAGAMENAGAVTFLESYIFRGQVPEAMVERRAVTLLHEMAHMWFGNLVTMRWWDDLWLNEAFAEFISHVATAEASRFETAWATFNATEKNWAYSQDQMPTTHPIVAPIRDLDDVLLNFDGITYAKGAAVLKALMAYVGRDNFSTAVEQYFADHAWSNTTLKDLLGAMEKTSGKDLGDWGRAWLETSGVNTLSTEVELNQDDTISALRVHQSGELLRPHQIKVGFYSSQDEKLVRTHDFAVEISEDSVQVPEAVGLARPELILLNDEDLTYAKIRLDEASALTVEHKLSAIDDPLARAVLWSWAWDIVRDGEQPATWFLALALHHLPAESQSSIIFNVMRQLSTAVNYYVPSSMIGEVRHDLAAGLWDMAALAEPGTDAQLQFVKAFITHARGDQLDTVAGLFNAAQEQTSESADTVMLDGLELSHELRWDMLCALVAGGRADEDDIAAELEADPTSSGELFALSARAAIPTPESKQDFWEKIVAGDELSNMGQRHAISGFTQVHDLTLLAPFVTEYFEVVDEVWGSRSHEMAETFALGLFPSWAVVPLTLSSTASAISRTEHTGLQRVLTELRDGLERALRARDTFGAK